MRVRLSISYALKERRFNSPLRDVWHQDVVERLEYEKDQRKMGMLTASIVSDFNCVFFLLLFHTCTIVSACRGNKWSAITIRMGETNIV